MPHPSNSGNNDPGFAPPPYQPGMYLDGIVGEVAETGRLYRPPSIAVPPPPKFQSAQSAQSIRRRISGGKAFALTVVFLVVVGIGTIGFLVHTLARSGHPQSEIVEQLKTETRGQILEQIARAQSEIARIPPPATESSQPPPADGNGTSPLDDYRYPGGSIQQSVAVLGNEVLQMTTTDSFASVREHYQKIAGSPILENIASGNDKVVFKIDATPPLVVTISREASHPGETSIAILRSKLIQGIGRAGEAPIN